MPNSIDYGLQGSEANAEEWYITLHIVNNLLNLIDMQNALDRLKHVKHVHGRVVVRQSYGLPIRMQLQNYSDVLNSCTYADELEIAQPTDNRR